MDSAKAEFRWGRAYSYSKYVHEQNQAGGDQISTALHSWYIRVKGYRYDFGATCASNNTSDEKICVLPCRYEFGNDSVLLWFSVTGNGGKQYLRANNGVAPKIRHTVR